MIKIWAKALGLIILATSITCLAQSSNGGGGFGTVASNLMDPVSLFYQFLQTACLLIGSGFLFASVVKYFEHRRSPLMVPISTVIFLLIAGIVLVALPLLAYVSQTGVQYRY